MIRWLLDEQGKVTRKDIDRSAQLGFSSLVVTPTDKLEETAELCWTHGLGVVPIIADWGDIKREHPEMAFRNHEDISSFDSVDPVVPPNNWPSFWHPKAMDLIRGEFKKAAETVGKALAGFAIGIGHGDASCMPINWHRCHRGQELSSDYFVFDRWAKAEYQRVYKTKDKPCARPQDDSDLRTLNLIQAAMLRRMGEMALAAREFTENIWCMILPFPSCSYLNMACGYAFGMHQRWAGWAREFAAANKAKVGFMMLHVLDNAVPNQVAQAAAMADPHIDCTCLIGVHNVIGDIEKAQELGVTGILCSPNRLRELAGEEEPSPNPYESKPGERKE